MAEKKRVFGRVQKKEKNRELVRADFGENKNRKERKTEKGKFFGVRFFRRKRRNREHLGKNRKRRRREANEQWDGVCDKDIRIHNFMACEASSPT